MENLYVLLGVCGLYCGGCYHYLASFAESRHLLEKAAGQGRSLEGFGCNGCRSGVLYCHPGCSQCAIRACAEDRGLVHCGLCTEFPFELLYATPGYPAVRVCTCKYSAQPCESQLWVIKPANPKAPAQAFGWWLGPLLQLEDAGLPFLSQSVRPTGSRRNWSECTIK